MGGGDGTAASASCLPAAVAIGRITNGTYPFCETIRARWAAGRQRPPHICLGRTMHFPGRWHPMTAMTRRWLARASFALLFAACETRQPVVTAWGVRG